MSENTYCVDWNTLSKSYQLEYTKDYFLSTYPLIHCIIKKELPADFIVHEINEQMEIAGEVNQNIPEQPTIVEVENEKADEEIENDVEEKKEYYWDDAMKQQIEDYVERCKEYHFTEELEITIPNNQKLQPALLQSISQNPHLLLHSQFGSLHLKHNPSYDDLIDIVGESEAKGILQFIIQTRIATTINRTYLTQPIEDKEKRRSLHLFFRSHYPYFQTSTQVNSILITFKATRKRQNRKQQNTQAKKAKQSFILAFTLKKTNVELLSLKTRLCQLLHCNEKALRFAGIKDKKAITYQYATIRDISPQQLLQASSELPSIEIGNFMYVTKEIKIGELWGNAFELTLREVDQEESVIHQAIEQMKEKGFVNYFGSQRLGTTWSQEAGPAAVGCFIVCGEWRKAIQLLIEPGLIFTEDRSIDALKEYRNNKNAKIAARQVPVVCYNLIALLRSIHRYGCDSLVFEPRELTPKENEMFYSILSDMSNEMISFYIKSFQSFLFNRIVQWRIQNYQSQLLPGDLVYSSTQQVISLTEAHISSGEYSFFDILLPLCGCEVNLPDNAVGKYYDELLFEYTGMHMSELNKSTNALLLPGSYRAIAAKPEQVESTYNKDDKTWKLSFRLKKGLYATTMINEMTYCGCKQY